MLISYVFRGEEVDLDVITRTDPIEFNIYGLTTEQYNALNVTAEEEMAICTHIAETLYDMAVNANPFED